MSPRPAPGTMGAWAARCRPDRIEPGGGTTRRLDHERTQNAMTRKTMAILAVLALGLLLTGGTALAARIGCKGGKCVGTEQADVMSGSLGADQIFALDGDDDVAATSGDDKVNGGDGRDTIFGEAGVDTLSGGLKGDRIVGGDDRDTIFGGSGSDVIDAASGEGLGPVADDVFCDTGFDQVTADRLDDVAADCEQVTRV